MRHAVGIPFVSLACAFLPSVVPAEESYGFAQTPPLAPEAAAKAMTLPPGFTVSVFAAEPDVRQPIALAIDDRGRLWVAENYAYPEWKPPGQGTDRILIFEDADGDGRFDKRTVFVEGLNFVSGLEVGFGGVWVGAPPSLLFYPDKDGDDKPDGPPEVLLDGWEHKDTHETLNSFAWGPDGWLYGCQGIANLSKVGRPGDPEDRRAALDACVWRYHPTRRQFEVFSEGTSNPWGLDFNAYGHAFITACVIPHLYHAIQGARYQRQVGGHFNPYTYDDIKTIADHLHWVGSDWRKSRGGKGAHGARGGGHAHAGAMFYLADRWPEAYRGDKLFMNNIHGARINVDALEPKGSGYVGRHAEDFLLANDDRSQIISLRLGPEGAVYMIDWYDAVQCHQQKERTERSDGRIFKVACNPAKPEAVELAKRSDAELVALLRHPNEWHARHARRLLQERGGAPEVRAALEKLLHDAPDTALKLRALWALHVTGGLTEASAQEALRSPDEHVRAWAVQLVSEGGTPSEGALSRFAEMARGDPSPVVRLYLASAMQCLPAARRWGVLEGLAAHGEDAADPNLPLMVWYALEPAVAADAKRALALAAKGKVPILREYAARRAAAAVR